jgi:hypothetical protein
MASKNNGQPKQHRGFACLTKEHRTRISAMGGTKTRKRYGRKHMSRIGKRGRAKRTRLEKKAKKASADNAFRPLSFSECVI